MLMQQGILLTKSLGQNFLHDQNQVQRIADAAQLTSGDQVLEIGPGLGPLTRAYCSRALKSLLLKSIGVCMLRWKKRFKERRP